MDHFFCTIGVCGQDDKRIHLDHIEDDADNNRSEHNSPDDLFLSCHFHSSLLGWEEYLSDILLFDEGFKRTKHFIKLQVVEFF